LALERGCAARRREEGMEGFAGGRREIKRRYKE